MSAFKIPKAVLTPSTRQFKIPETIMSDYTNYLHTDVPNVVYDFHVLKSWYDQFDEKDPVYIRAEHFPINWKSKVGNSDLNYNFFTDYTVPIRKGDIVVREDGVIAMLNWNIQRYINAQTTQAIECNHYITITREIDAVADEYGYVVEPEQTKTIVEKLPCVMSEYAGRPDYAVAQNTPGINADMLTNVSLQWNEKTKNILIGDHFEYLNHTYRVINMSWAEVDINRTHGVIVLNARRIAGEHN